MIHDCNNCKYELYDVTDEPCKNCRHDELGTITFTKWESDNSENVDQEIINFFSPDLFNAVKNLKDECYSLDEIIKAVKTIYERVL